MRGVILIGLCFLAALSLHAEPELRGSPYDLEKYLSGVPKTVSVTGEGEIKLPADRAVVMLTISTENKSLQEALRLNQESRKKLLSYLAKKGLPLDRMQASKFSSTPKYGWFSDKAKSYLVDNFVKATVQDESEFQALAGAVDMWPEIQYLSIDFEHGNKQALKAQAIAKACDNANEKKKMYEEKFGVQLSVKKFSEGEVEETGLVVQHTGDYSSENFSRPARKGFGLSEPRPAGASPNSVQEGMSPFGELTFTARVSVEYSVEQK